MITIDLIVIDKARCTLDELFNDVCKTLEQKNLIDDVDSVLCGLREREKIVPTLFENGVGIPHTSQNSIFKTTLVLVTSKEGIVYTDGRVANLIIFLLTAPDSGSDHLEMMSKLSSVLLDPEKVTAIINETNGDDVIEYFQAEDQVSNKKIGDDTILAITACTTGIAHTYIAANALEKAAEKLGINIYVERQGANGIENKIPENTIVKAKGLILATDVEVEGLERFTSLPVLKTSVAEPIDNAEQLIDNILKQKFTDRITTQQTKLENKLIEALLAGFSEVIPLFVFGALIFSISLLPFSGVIQNFSILSTKIIYGLIYILYCARLSKNLGGKTGFYLGIIAALITGPFTDTGINFTEGNIFNAALLAAIVGYFIKEVQKYIMVPELVRPLKGTLIVPLVGLLVTFGIQVVLLEPIFNVINNMSSYILSFDISQFIISILIIVGICYDYGGRVNKLSNMIAVGLALNGLLAMTACNLAIVLPTASLGVTTLLGKNKQWFNGSSFQSFTQLITSGLFAVSEGSIPFVKKYKQLYVSNIVGVIVTYTIVVKLGAVAWLPLPAIWAWIFIVNPWSYVTAFIIGSICLGLTNYIIISYLERGTND